MVKAAGELALSCLPHAHNLNPNEISRALIQTKEIRFVRNCHYLRAHNLTSNKIPRALIQTRFRSNFEYGTLVWVGQVRTTGMTKYMILESL